MGWIEDRWHVTVKNPDGSRKQMESPRYGKGRRWRVRYDDPPYVEHARSFARKPDAEGFLEHLRTHGCLVPDCPRGSVTELPVLLCADHRDLVVAEATRKRPNVHAPIVYFVVNGTRVKIGWTTNLKSRMTSLSLPMSSVALKLDGGPEREAALHHAFADSRIKGTEWFELTPRITRYIQKHTPQEESAA